MKKGIRGTDPGIRIRTKMSLITNTVAHKKNDGQVRKYVFVPVDEKRWGLNDRGPLAGVLSGHKVHTEYIHRVPQSPQCLSLDWNWNWIGLE
jgi:hypothetical protein